MPYAMARMTYIWGDDAEEFRPERWLQNGVFQPESPFKFTAFQVTYLSPVLSIYVCKNPMDRYGFQSDQFDCSFFFRIRLVLESVWGRSLHTGK